MNRSLLSLLAGLLMAAGALMGQGSVGTLTGTAMDATGAVVPGATVVITNVGTGIESHTSTTSVGAYTVPHLSAGMYTIRVSGPGFRTSLQENVTLRVGQTLTVDILLEVGAVTEEVMVTSAVPLLESGTAEIGHYISAEEFQNWPIIVGDGQRQIQDFIFRSLPGTTGGTFQGSINGGQQYSHEILIEGIPLGRMDLSGGNNNEMSPSVEAIGEFKLQTGAMGAQYNGGQTAVANFGFKSGTNELHGSAYYYGQNEALNANSYSNNSRGRERSVFRQHNFGFSAGGPVYIPKVYDGRNRTFFFFSYEQTQRSVFNISGITATLAPQAFKQGDFSRLMDAAYTGNAGSGSAITNDQGQSAVFGQIADPLSTANGAGGAVTRVPFANNVIPQSRFSGVYNNILGIGLVDADTDDMVRNKAALGTCCPFFDLRTKSIKGDHNITQRHRVSGLLNSEYRIRNNGPGPRFEPVPGLPTQAWQDQFTPSQMVRMSLNSTLSPTMLNRFSGGYNRFRNTNESVFVGQGLAEKIGVRGTAPTHFPRMNFSGNEWQGGTIGQIGSSAAGGSFNGSWIFQDDLTIIKGAHSFRLGWEYRRYFYNSRSKNGSGNFNFSPVQTRLPGFATQTGNAFASFVLGAVNSGSRNVSTLFSGHRNGSNAFYFMDDWKVTPKLTLNLGLRWEIIGSFYEVTGRNSQVDLDTPNPAAEGRPGALVFGNRFQDTNWTQLGPRFGFAYRVNEKMVVRGGYGITNMPPIRNDWGFGAFTTGFSANIPINAGTSATGFADDPSHYLDNPYPALQTPLPNTDPGQQTFTGLSTTARDSNRLPYTQNWNMTLQYQLPSDTVFEAAYVANKGTRLWNGGFRSLNDLPTSFLSLGDTLRDQVGDHPEFKPYASFPDDQSVAQALRAFPQYTSLREAYPYNSNSSYNSLQVTLTRHFTDGLSLLTAYTWSKSIGYSNNARGGGSVQNVFDRGLERSETGFNIPQVFRLTWIYETPFGKGKRFNSNKAVNMILGGWTFSAIHEYRNGNPISVSQSGLSTPSGFGRIRPDVTGSAFTVGGAPDELDFFEGTPYLDPGAFAESPRTAGGVPTRVGTASRVLPGVRGPHVASERMRMTRGFMLHEGVEFEFGFVAVNPFNRHSRSFVSTNVSSSSFGKLRVSGGGQRVLQLEGRITF